MFRIRNWREDVCGVIESNPFEKYAALLWSQAEMTKWSKMWRFIVVPYTYKIVILCFYGRVAYR